MSLEIDLNLHNYRSKRLTPSLLLAIAKHPSLVKLEWSVPDQIRCHYFGRALLYVCHHRSMQELYLKRKHSPSDYEYEDWDGWLFSLDRYKCTSLDLAQDDSLEYMDLQAKLDANTPLDQLGGPFAFKKLFLEAGFDGYEWSSYTPFSDMIRMCPHLVDVCVHAYWKTHITTIDLLAERCPVLRGIDFSVSGKNPTANDLSLFSQLQRIRFMDYMPDFQFSKIFNATLSQRESLEVIAIGLQYISAPDAVQIIKTFPNLRVLDLGCLRIFVHDLSSEDSQTGCLQSRADLRSLDIVVKEWAPYSATMQYTEMDFWWSAWNEAQQFMDSFVRFYRQWSGQPPLRPVHMRFMYPLKHFMRVTEAMMYSNVVEDGPEDRRPMTIEDVQRLACCIRDWTWWHFTIDERCPGLVLGSWGWEEEEEENFDQAYELSKSRNRHHTLRNKKRSPFRRPFKK
ncbi:hypothetical protein BG006_006072 [Podila minutissima]|uniref:Uncharacterized protein n=1 Tax=Podila minutissima TaxID=64525 RepID=A0A9P5SJ18_9FUNG|nr:hypothetical protein BG006_006072 [Podila minutissima]